jgi:OmcA/MtrC family decaheme c-type cytochrome
MFASARVLVIFLSLGLAACTGDTGPAGPAGPDGPIGDNGQNGDDGDDGDDGQDGDDGRNAWVVGEGLQFEITAADIDANGVATVTYTIADGDGVPLDLDGLYTEGSVSPSFVLAYLDEDGNSQPLQYTAYTTRDQTSPITNETETQAATDSGGIHTYVADGEYTYEFGTTATVADDTLTHTVAVYASRTFRDVRYISNTTFDFVPDGSNVSVTRDVVTNDACNACHGQLGIHGDRRRDVALCITCHQPQSVDPDTGNTVDMQVMIHKIHMGELLPSVVSGTPYEIIGYMQSSHDYSSVVFPKDNRSCDTCHTGADGDLWKDRPTILSCGSCHDDIAFANPPGTNQVLHTGGEQTDADCANCHPANGGAAGVVDSHLYAFNDPATPIVEVTVNSVTNTGPGQAPVVDFTVTIDGQGEDILTTPLNRLRFTIAGPTTDYEEYWQVDALSVGVIAAIDAPNGQFSYTFDAPDGIPAAAEGSYALSYEARYRPASTNYNAFNEVTYFAVTDTDAVPRRSIVDTGNCNNCHEELSGHGGSRKNADYCVFCHLPDNTNDDRIARVEGTTVFAETVDMKRMIHGIHRGEDLENAYVLGAYPTPNTNNPEGTQHDFAHTRYPNDLRACGTCHIAGSEDLPLPATALPSRVETLTCIEDPGDDVDDYCDTRTSVEAFIPPTQSVCTACHDGAATVAHSEIMTAPSGDEACTTCHGPGSAFDTALYHQRNP